MLWESDLRYVSAAVLVMVGTGMKLATASVHSIMEAYHNCDQENPEGIDNDMIRALVLLTSFVIYHNLVVKRIIAWADGVTPGTTTNSSSSSQQQQIQIPIVFATLVSNDDIYAEIIQDDGMGPRGQERQVVLDAAIPLEEVQVEVGQDDISSISQNSRSIRHLQD